MTGAAAAAAAADSRSSRGAEEAAVSLQFPEAPPGGSAAPG